MGEEAQAGGVSGPLFGTIKAWYGDKGMGFISPYDGSEDVFCHSSTVGPPGSALIEGECVAYTIGPNPTKPGKMMCVAISGPAVTQVGPLTAQPAGGKGALPPPRRWDPGVPGAPTALLHRPPPIVAAHAPPAAGLAPARAMPSGMRAVRRAGTMKACYEEKGMGFITEDGSGEDQFFHFTALFGGGPANGGAQPPPVGSRVAFELEENRMKPGKFQAVRVSPLDADPYQAQAPQRIAAAPGGGNWAPPAAHWNSGGTPSHGGGGMQAHSAAEQSHSGVVKAWYGQKGMGFITDDGGLGDQFCHSSIVGDGMCLVEGMPVTYMLGPNPRKPGQVQVVSVSGAGVAQSPEAVASAGGAPYS